MNKTYKDFEKRYIGSSDIATIIAVGFDTDGKDGACIKTGAIHFGSDGGYSAYYVDDASAEIGAHYEKVFECSNWLKVYDDNGLTLRVDEPGATISIYQAGNFGCIIRVER